MATVPTDPSTVVIDPGTPTPSTPRRNDAPYRDVVGTWKGIGFQYNTNTHWDFEMTLMLRGQVGDAIGSISYEGGKCTAELIRQPERDNGETLAMTEHLITGQGNCVDGGTIRIPRRPIGNELDWKWDFANGQEGANASPRRQ